MASHALMIMSPEEHAAHTPDSSFTSDAKHGTKCQINVLKKKVEAKKQESKRSSIMETFSTVV